MFCTWESCTTTCSRGQQVFLTICVGHQTYLAVWSDLVGEIIKRPFRSAWSDVEAFKNHRPALSNDVLE